jgi:hypothetical protein
LHQQQSEISNQRKIKKPSPALMMVVTGIRHFKHGFNLPKSPQKKANNALVLEVLCALCGDHFAVETRI